MRMTSKGQVTIPAAIRKKAGLLPKTRVEIAYDGEVVIIRRAGRKLRDRGAQLVAHLRKFRGDITMTTDEIMTLTRGDD